MDLIFSWSSSSGANTWDNGNQFINIASLTTENQRQENTVFSQKQQQYYSVRFIYDHVGGVYRPSLSSNPFS